MYHINLARCVCEGDGEKNLHGVALKRLFTNTVFKNEIWVST